MHHHKQTKGNNNNSSVTNPFGGSGTKGHNHDGTTNKGGYETPQFQSQESHKPGDDSNGKGTKANNNCTPTSSFLLELQHSQITEVNSEYEVT